MNNLTNRGKVPSLVSVNAGHRAEKHRISRELHDRIGQPLTVLKLISERITKSPGQNSQLLEEMPGLISKVLSDLRDICINLEPVADNSDIRWVLFSLIERSSKQSRINVNFMHDGLQEAIAIPAVTSHAIAVIVQEALSNACLHAGVNEVKIKIWNTGAEIQVDRKSVV